MKATKRLAPQTGLEGGHRGRVSGFQKEGLTVDWLDDVRYHSTLNVS